MTRSVLDAVDASGIGAAASPPRHSIQEEHGVESRGHEYKTIDEYIAAAPEAVRSTLQALRKAIREEAPDAEEAIKYSMPTFVLNGNLVHFAAMKNHIGFYPTPSPIEAFAKELAQYKTSKGAIQLPITEPLPFPLIRRIVRSRVKDMREKTPKRK
jgi:uncharacterized protein YdhG (YjbR/CyaY superfamily)